MPETKKLKTNSESLSDYVHSVGKRKTTVSRIWIKKVNPQEGYLIINDRTAEDFFSSKNNTNILKIFNLFRSLDLDSSCYRIVCFTSGGGLTGCTDSIILGIARALCLYDPSLSFQIRKKGYLTRDSRVVEPKKYGLRKARRREQYSKR